MPNEDPDGRAAPETPARAARPEPPTYDDEISLRELYLILLRGLPLIVGLALLAGVAAYLYGSLQPNTYEAEATVLSGPSTVRVREQGTLQFEPGDAIGFEAYQTLAMSRPVLERTLASVNGVERDETFTYRDLEGVAEVERVAGPDGGGDVPLIVAHRVSGTDPARTAELANAWSETTVTQVRETLLANLAPAQEDTAATVERRRATLEELEAELEAFEAEDRRSQLRAQLDGVEQRHASNDGRLESLDLQIADARGRLAAMGSSPEEALDEATLSLLQNRGARGGPGNLLVEGPNAAVLADLAAADLAGALREREAAEALDATFEARADRLREQIAMLDRRATELSRRVSEARTAYNTVAELQPLIDYVADLTPGNTRLINEAQAPVAPSGPRRLLITALAVVVVGMLATLFVFLREAVRAPEPEVEGSQRPADDAARA